MRALLSRRLRSQQQPPHLPAGRQLPALETLERRALLNAVPVGPEFTVTPPERGSQQFHQVAHDVEGNFVIAWTNASNRAVLAEFAQQFDASGNPIGGAFQVGAHSYGESALAMNPAGDFVVAWADAFATTGRVHLRRYSAAGAPRGAEMTLPQETGYPSLAMADDGDFVLVYGISDSRRPQYQVFNADGTPRGPAADVNDGAPPPAGIYAPASVAADAAGNFVVAFPTDFGRFRRFDDAGRPLGPSAPVMPDDRIALRTGEVLLDAAMNSAGDFVISLEGLPGLSARAFDRTGAPRSGRVLLAEGISNVDSLDVDIAADGGFVGTWWEQFPGGLRARAYDAAGVALGDQFTVSNTGASPSVTLGAGGDMVFAWTQAGGVNADGPFAEIHARRFARVAKPVALDRVFVKGTGWTRQFTDHLGAYGFGTSAWGYAAGGTPDPLAVPWTALNQVTIRFTRDVDVKRGDLKIRGVSVPEYQVDHFDYDPVARAATWTLERPIGADRLTFTLDGSALSAPGEDAADYVFPLNVVPGDENRDGAVNAVDLAQVWRRNTTSTDHYYGSTPGFTYQIFADVTGDGRINALDLGAAKRNLNRKLPGPAGAATLLLR